MSEYRSVDTHRRGFRSEKVRWVYTWVELFCKWIV